MVTKICVGNYVGDIYHLQNFIQIGLGVSVLRMRDLAPLGTKWLVFFGVFKRRGSAQGMPFGGRETKI